MKKIISIILCTVFILSLSGCKKSEKTETIDFNKIGSSSSSSSSVSSSDSEKSGKASSDSEKSSTTDKNVSDKDTSASVSVGAGTDSGSKAQSGDFAEVIENNALLSDITEKAEAMKKVESFSFKLNATKEDLIDEDKDEYKAEGALKYDDEKGTITLKMKYNNEDVVVISNKDKTLIATRESSDDEWEISSSKDSDSDGDALDKIIDIITKVRTFGESGNFNSTDLINKLFSYLGLDAMSDKETVNQVAKNIIETFTNEENLKELLDFSKAENTDGMTYSLNPDLTGCMDELTSLMEPLFPDEDSYNAFAAIMSMQQLSMMGSKLKASIKLDKNNYINTAKLNFSSTSSLLTAQLNISDINSAKVKIDSDLQKLIDKKS